MASAISQPQFDATILRVGFRGVGGSQALPESVPQEVLRAPWPPPGGSTPAGSASSPATARSPPAPGAASGPFRARYRRPSASYPRPRRVAQPERSEPLCSEGARRGGAMASAHRRQILPRRYQRREKTGSGTVERHPGSDHGSHSRAARPAKGAAGSDGGAVEGGDGSPHGVAGAGSLQKMPAKGGAER